MEDLFFVYSINESMHITYFVPMSGKLSLLSGCMFVSSGEGVEIKVLQNVTYISDQH